jgi:hypothetical protein
MQTQYAGQQAYPYGYTNSYYSAPGAPYSSYPQQPDMYGQQWAATGSTMPGYVPAANSTSLPRPKHASRTSSLAGHKVPLKSAMKKGGTGVAVPMQRTRTISDTRSRASSVTRQRSNTRAELVPGSLRPLSFSSSCFTIIQSRIPIRLLSRQ